ncbi:putative gustatory receptor 28b [Ceratina calcarata]|uniref:Gustatory receptor n=1 Tax=Ceratina calcarata TaxID=156304 RepID=A0AAJ7IZZ7_9HYME|nr:putative gustatory receptor 28b [Ceratina calcarata]
MGVLDLKPNLLNKIYEYVYTAISLILLNSMIVLFWSRLDEVNYNIQLNKIEDLVGNTSYFIQITILNIVIILSRINSQKLRKVLELIESYNRKMENMGLATRHQALFMYQIKIISLYGIAIISYFVVMHIIYYKGLMKITIESKLCLTFIQITISFLTCVSDISFCIWIKYFRIKFEQMNEMVRGMLTTTPDSPQHRRVLGLQYDFKNKMFTSFRNESKRGSNASAYIIRTLKQRHLELIKIARMMNTAYGIQIALMMTVSFVSTIALLYMWYRTIWMNYEILVLLSETMPFAYYILFSLWRIVYENHVCAKTCSEALEIGDIICELHEPSASKEFRTEIQDFTLQLIQNPLIFTGYGFFDLGHAFIQEVLGSITTYLVILIQVGDMSTMFTETGNNNSTENGTSPMQNEDL